MAYVRKLPAGTVGWTGSSAHEPQMEDIFMPCDTRLVAVNVGPDGTFGTLVYDTNQNNEYDKDRSAWLQSAFRVIKKPLGKTNAIAFQLTDAGNKDTKGGYFVDKGDGSGAHQQTPTGPTATGGSRMVATGGGPVGGAVGGPPQDAETVVDQPGKSGGIIIGEGSFNDEGPFHVGNKADKHKHGVDADGNPINALHIWTNALFYNNKIEDGPLRFEKVYKKGQDQKKIVPVHLAFTGHDWAWWSTTFFYEPDKPPPPYPPHTPYPSYPMYPYPINTTTNPVVTPGDHTIIDRPPVITGGRIPVATPSPSTGWAPGDGPGGPLIQPGGNTTATPGGTGGTTGGGTTGGGTGPGSNTGGQPGVATGGQPGGPAGPGGGGNTGGEGGAGSGEPGAYDDPSAGDQGGLFDPPPIDDPSAGPQGGLFGPIDPYAPPKPPHFDLPFDPAAPVYFEFNGSSQGGPIFNMITSTTPILNQASIYQGVNYNPGAADPGLFGSATSSALGKQDTTSPLTGAASSFAAQGGTTVAGPPSTTPPTSPPYPNSPAFPTPPPSPAPTPTPSWPPTVAPPPFPPFPPSAPPTTTGGMGDPWNYATSPRDQTIPGIAKSRYQSGTADGGIVYHPIETDLRDAMTNGMVPPGVTLNDFYVICAPNAYFGVGVPNLKNGSIQSGYRWSVDSTTGDLVFDSVSYSQPAVQAMRFTNTGQTIQWNSGVYRYGELYHQNTANRRYTFPDTTGTVALFGTGIYPSGTPVAILGGFGSGPANFYVYRWIPWVDILTNQTVYLPVFI